VYEDLEVKLCPSPAGDASPAGGETFVLPAGRHGLCRSKARAQKEKAMHERFSKRPEAPGDRNAVATGPAEVARGDQNRIAM